MSYQVLARKWRPHRFEDMVGQRHVLQALTNALDSDRLHHAYLFTGTRGVGKTTVARIFAKSLNCESGVTASPCGQCSACQEIDQGRFVDLIEVDAASRTGVDDTRELLDNVQYAPARGRYKVYLIDEVHMFSKSSFNALLKTLEEPPPHIKFLLATTDPKKIPPTILSRCLQFSLKRLTPDQIEQQLAHILKEEGIEGDTRSLEMLATAADGSLRDALSLLDQAIAFGNGKLEAEDVASMLGTIDKDQVLELLEILIKGNAADVIDKAGLMAQSSPDYSIILTEILAQLQALAVLQMVPDARADQRDTPRLKPLIDQISPEACQLYYQIALNGLRDLSFHPNPAAGFEMCLLRMLAFKPEGVVFSKAEKKKSLTADRAEASSRQDATERSVKEADLNSSLASSERIEALRHPQDDNFQPATLVNVGTERIPTASNNISSRSETVSKDNFAEIVSRQPESDQTKLDEQPQHVLLETDQPAETEIHHSPKITLDSVTPPQWHDLITAMQLKGMVYQLAISCVFERFEKQTCQLAMPEGTICTDGIKDQLEKSLRSYFDQPIRLVVQEKAIEAVETPKAKMEREADERLEHARQVIESDPNIQTLRDMFDATVIEESIVSVKQESTGENP